MLVRDRVRGDSVRVFVNTPSAICGPTPRPVVVRSSPATSWTPGRPNSESATLIPPV